MVGEVPLKFICAKGGRSHIPKSLRTTDQDGIEKVLSIHFEISGCFDAVAMAFLMI